MSAKVHTHYIPSHGPDDASIMVVGEAGGAEEDEHSLPFVGRAGKLMSQHFERHGVNRDLSEVESYGTIESDIFVTNLSKFRPHNNQFRHLIGTVELDMGIAELKEEIARVDPEVIVAMGNWPLFFLTGKCGEKNGKPEPGSGIGKYRGSILPCALVEGKKVVATHHPAYILRNFLWHPIFDIDIAKVVRQSAFPDVQYPIFDVLIDPPNLWELVDELCDAEWLSFDIETFSPGEMSCFGVTDRADRVIVLTYQNPDGWEAARRICESPAKKIAQYGTYDCRFLNHFFGWDINNYAFDTYIATAEILPQFPRGLDFLTSIYTDLPYYKEERKRWKKTMDLNLLWQYNAKDVVATWIIAFEQMKDLEALYGWRMESGTLVSA